MLTLVLVMSTSAFAISESDVESAVSASGKEAVSGNVLVWFLCAVAFLKVSQKIDSFLSSLGLNVGHTGGSMLSEAMIAMRAINTATSAVGSALGSRSRHGSAPASGKPGGGSAAAAGFFSGGLVGMASRKIASDAVRTATTEKNIVQPQQAEATVSRTHASSDTHSGSQTASEQQRQNTSQLDQNQQTVSFRAVKSEQRENSQQALHESQHSVDASQIHQDSEDFQVLAITTMVSSFVAEWNDRSMKLYHEWKVMPSPPLSMRSEQSDCKAWGTAFEIQTQYIRTGSTCQLWKYEKCCSFLFVSGYFRIIHKRHVEILRSCSLRQQLRRYHQPLTGGIGYIIAPATGRKGQNDIIDLFPVERREQRSIRVLK